jgi:hypothetical protein
MAANLSPREQLRARLARCEAEAHDIRAQIAALDTGEQAHRARAKAIVRRMADIEREARNITTSDGWATDPLAIEYRALMREWWALPIPIPHTLLAESPSAGRMLTSKSSIVVEGKTDGERAMEAASRHQRQLREAAAHG